MLTNLLGILRGAVPPRLEPRFGIGPGRFAATVAASSAQAGQVLQAPPNLLEFLAPYPVEVLPVDWDTVTRIKRLGLKTLGDIARQKLGPMQAQFGPQGKPLWEMARGIDDPDAFQRNVDNGAEVSLDRADSSHHPDRGCADDCDQGQANEIFCRRNAQAESRLAKGRGKRANRAFLKKALGKFQIPTAIIVTECGRQVRQSYSSSRMSLTFDPF